MLLQEATKSNNYNFLEVCGVGCIMPGIGWLAYRRCYQTTAGMQRIDSTGDVIASDFHLTFKREAWKFAEKYNLMLVSRLDSLGKKTCGSRERWDDLYFAIDTMIQDLTQEHYRVRMHASVDHQKDGYDFALDMPDSLKTKQSLLTRLCSLPQKFGIEKKIRFQVTVRGVSFKLLSKSIFTCGSEAFAL